MCGAHIKLEQQEWDHHRPWLKAVSLGGFLSRIGMKNHTKNVCHFFWKQFVSLLDSFFSLSINSKVGRHGSRVCW